MWHNSLLSPPPPSLVWQSFGMKSQSLCRDSLRNADSHFSSGFTVALQNVYKRGTSFTQWLAFWAGHFSSDESEFFVGWEKGTVLVITLCFGQTHIVASLCGRNSLMFKAEPDFWKARTTEPYFLFSQCCVPFSFVRLCALFVENYAGFFSSH